MITKILVINLPTRTDRLKHITEELGRLGQTFQRFDPVVVDSSCNFQNKAIRSNWMSHEECLRIAADNKDGLTLVLEDDAKFKGDWADVEKYVRQVQEKANWDVLYLYGNNTDESVRRIKMIHCTHAYIPNPASAGKIRDMLMAERARIERGLDKDLRVIDWYCTRVLQELLEFYGTPLIACQARWTFGSDLGWGWRGSKKVYD